MAQLQFDASQFDPAQGMELWPDGWHDCVLVKCEPRGTKVEGSGMLGCLIQAISGPMTGKQQFFGLNLWNKNETAVRMANETLSAITYVTLGANQHRLTFNDTNELCNIPFKIMAERQSDQPMRNNFRSFKDQWGNDPKSNGGQPAGGPQGGPPAPSFAPQPQQAPAPAPGGWAPPGGGPAPAPAPQPPQPQWTPPQQQQQPPAPQQQPQPPQPQFQAPPQPQQQQWTPPNGGAPQQQQPQPQWAPPAGGGPAPSWAAPK